MYLHQFISNTLFEESNMVIIILIYKGPNVVWVREKVYSGGRNMLRVSER
jgi:hypothetical protein